VTQGDGAAVTLRRARDLPALLAFLEPFEPRTTSVIADLLADGLGPRQARAWTAEVDRQPAGAVVLHRSGFDRWHARCLVADPAAARPIAALLDRSPAWSVTGPGTDLAPLVGLTRRERAVSSMPWVVAEAPVSVTDRSETDPHVRDATPSDLDALVELYRDFELASETTVWQLRGTLRRILDRRRILVYEHEGRPVGALVVSGPTARYFVADGLTVLPEYRNRGLGWTLAARAQGIANSHDLGVTAAIAATNAMSFTAVDLDPASWAVVALGAPNRFKGQTRLRRLYSRIGRRDSVREAVVLRTADATVIRPDERPKTQEGGP
jgi:N-acetylglutamate synthase-like GNAT family acetyltransferase